MGIASRRKRVPVAWQTALPTAAAVPTRTTSQRVRLVDQVGIDLARISSGQGKAALGADGKDLRWVI